MNNNICNIDKVDTQLTEEINNNINIINEEASTSNKRTSSIIIKENKRKKNIIYLEDELNINDLNREFGTPVIKFENAMNNMNMNEMPIDIDINRANIEQTINTNINHIINKNNMNYLKDANNNMYK